jgi:hypothetical protein
MTPVRYAAVGAPNQVVRASASPSRVALPPRPTYSSGRINTAVGTDSPMPQAPLIAAHGGQSDVGLKLHCPEWQLPRYCCVAS